MAFSRAKKGLVAPKIAIQGVSGAGKTYGALLFARGYVGNDGQIAVIDTENNSSSLYADLTSFDVANISPRVFNDGQISAFWWTDFKQAIQDAINAKYDALIIDSASHIWQATLDFKARLDSAQSNSFVNWNKAGETFATIQNLILQAPIPVLCCFRSKMEYVVEQDAEGKQRPRKVGLAPITRNDSEYDFTLVFDIGRDHVARVTKSRCNSFSDDFEKVLTIQDGENFRLWIQGVNSNVGRFEN